MYVPTIEIPVVHDNTAVPKYKVTPANLQAGIISGWCKACRSSPVARLLDVAAAATAATAAAAAAADRLAGMPQEVWNSELGCTHWRHECRTLKASILTIALSDATYGFEEIIM